MSQEDKLVNNLIERERAAAARQAEKFDTEFDVSVEPEAHYNYYGDRGVADLYVQKTERGPLQRDVRTDKIYEVKSAAALQESTGANDVLRQFNRMRRYFYEDERRSLPDDYVFELCFVIQPETVEHVAENLGLYSSTIQESLGPNSGKLEDCQGATVTLRQAEGDASPARLTRPHYVDNLTDPSNWKDGVSMLETAGAPLVVDILDDLGY